MSHKFKHDLLFTISIQPKFKLAIYRLIFIVNVLILPTYQPLTSANSQLLDATSETKCLNCIRNVTQLLGIDGSKRCEDYNCGPFQISYAYWTEAGKPGTKQGARDYERCVRDRNCAEQTVRAYFQKFKRDCNSDGQVDCHDMAALHKGGPISCGSDWFFKSRYWVAFNRTSCSTMNSQSSDSSKSDVLGGVRTSQGDGWVHNKRPIKTNESLTSECLDCICDAVSGCNLASAICPSSGSCGPFSISQTYWKDGRRPGASWAACVRTKECSSVAMKNYMERFKRDCNGDGVINCEDYAAIHKAGPKGCSNRNLLRDSYWNKFLACRANQTPVKDVSMVKLSEPSPTESQLRPEQSEQVKHNEPHPSQMPAQSAAEEVGPISYQPSPSSSSSRLQTSSTIKYDSIIHHSDHIDNQHKQQQQNHNQHHRNPQQHHHQSAFPPTRSSSTSSTPNSIIDRSEFDRNRGPADQAKPQISLDDFYAKPSKSNHEPPNLSTTGGSRYLTQSWINDASSSRSTYKPNILVQTKTTTHQLDDLPHLPTDGKLGEDTVTALDQQDDTSAVTATITTTTTTTTVTPSTSTRRSIDYTIIPNQITPTPRQDQQPFSLITSNVPFFSTSPAHSSISNEQTVWPSDFDNVVSGIMQQPDFVKSIPDRIQAPPEPPISPPSSITKVAPQTSGVIVSNHANNSAPSEGGLEVQEQRIGMDQRSTINQTVGQGDNPWSIYTNSNLNESNRISDDCLECICDASSNCDTSVQCISKQREKNRCGLYMISWNQFQDSDINLFLPFLGINTGNASSIDDQPDEEKSYHKCSMDKQCAEKLIQLYIEKHEKDCNNDGKFDCYDIAAIHRVGPENCNSRKLLDSQYWRDFNTCYTTDRLTTIQPETNSQSSPSLIS